MRVFFLGMFRGRRAFRIRMLEREEIAHNFREWVRTKKGKVIDHRGHGDSQRP
jgi:hypothetical protein